jgi:predicted transcriptional regulator
MTRTIELPDELAAALKQVAEAEHRSVNSILVIAATEYVQRRNQRALVAATTQKVIELDRELLERLAQ